MLQTRLVTHKGRQKLNKDYKYTLVQFKGTTMQTVTDYFGCNCTLPLTETVGLAENVNPSVALFKEPPGHLYRNPLTLSWYDPESDTVRSLMMMLQFFWFRSDCSSDTRPLNWGWTFLLFLLVWNITSESPHLRLDSHLYQTICSVIKTWLVLKEHGITTQSPASAVISPSLRVIQYPLLQCSTDAPVTCKRNTATEGFN